MCPPAASNVVVPFAALRQRQEARRAHRVSSSPPATVCFALDGDPHRRVGVEELLAAATRQLGADVVHELDFSRLAFERRAAGCFDVRVPFRSEPTS
jgi:hypothetical protein